MSNWHLYLIRTHDGSLYAGIASDVARRFAEHQASGARCAQYLRGRGPLELVYAQEIGDRSLALRAENRVKGLPKVKKEQIVRSNPSGKDLIVQLGIVDR